MNGSHDPYASARKTQAQMWPSARNTYYVGTNYYQLARDGGESE